MILAALSMRDDAVASYGEVRSSLSTEWAAWLGSIGATPVAVPNGAANVAVALDRIQPDIVILTGGNDVVPGDDPSRVSEARNQTEKNMVDWAIRSGRPVLGVCRGLQFLNAYFGGSIATAMPGSGKAHVAKVHSVRLHRFLRDLAGVADAQVNSFHDQGVLVADVAEDFDICATADGAVVEGLRHRTQPIAAVQWHPERPHGQPELCGRIVRHLLDTADLKGAA